MLLTISQAAKELGVSAETVRRKIRDGVWPFYKLGPKSTRIDPDEIRAMARLATYSTTKKTDPSPKAQIHSEKTATLPIRRSVHEVI
jgi:excisionase family DNA binding protein